MNRNKSTIANGIAVAMFTLILTFASSAFAQTYKVLYNFGVSGAHCYSAHICDGAVPSAGLAFDSNGNLYGTTQYGGYECFIGGCGTVFELTPSGGGSWTERLLYAFQGCNNQDGGTSTAPVVIRGGNLYGTAGSYGVDCFAGGMVFELMPNPAGPWRELIIDNFGFISPTFSCPCPGVTFDSTGHLYGTAGGFSSHDPFGAVLELGHVSPFNWYQLLPHVFLGGSDGSGGNGPVVLDPAGNLYSTTEQGGTNLVGDVFKLASAMSRFGWVETQLYSFRGGADGAYPTAGVVFDTTGNLYGTTTQGGTAGAGTVFKLTPNPDGTWSESVLYSFQGGSDASAPNSTVTFDAEGNLYGTAGGGAYGHGAVFKLTRSGDQWTESVVYSFTGGLDGDSPSGGVILDSTGNIYGTTQYGGAYPTCNDGPPFCGGVAYEITP
jgi:uncharacterized repeat protein (TIGR03803 family)